jgi:hypothetical protein
MSSYNYNQYDLSAERSYQGVNATGRVMIFHPPERGHISNPVIFVWGFDPGSSQYRPDQAFSLVNGDADAGLGDYLLAAGHDVIILMPQDTTTYLQANALWVVRAIESIYGSLPQEVPNTVIGCSAGGVIARWALLYMEDRLRDQNPPIRLSRQTTAQYFSFDTPHRGANVPLGVQWYVNFVTALVHNTPLINNINQLKEKIENPRKLVNSIAARQLASYHWGGINQNKKNPTPDPLRIALLNELGGRWPQGIKRFGIANGHGMGKTQSIMPGEVIMSISGIHTFRAMPKNWEECQIVSIGPERGAAAWAWIWKGLYPLDSSPGSTGTFYNQVWGAIGSGIINEPPPMCFVPTTSALDCSDDCWYGAPTTEEGVRNKHWNDWYFSNSNDAHVRVTRPIREFILNYIPPIPRP